MAVVVLLGLGLSSGGRITRVLLLPSISNIVLIIIVPIIFKYLMNPPKTQVIVNPMIKNEHKEETTDTSTCASLCDILLFI